MLSRISLSKIFASVLNLASDNAKETNIDELENRSFAIAIDEFPQDIGIRAENGKIYPLSDEEIPNADVMISGNVKAVLNMIQNRDGLESDELYIAGKISTARCFQNFLSNLAIDWQGLFEKFMSPEAAKKSVDALAQGVHFAKASKDKALEGLRTYLIEDKKLFVSRSELDDLKGDICELRQRLDALRCHIDNELVGE